MYDEPDSLYDLDGLPREDDGFDPREPSPCPTCGGRGVVYYLGPGPHDCPQCDGTGEIIPYESTPF